MGRERGQAVRVEGCRKHRENKGLCAAGRLLGEPGFVLEGAVFIKPSCRLAMWL